MNLKGQQRTLGEETQAVIGRAKRRSYYKPSMKRLGLLRERTARRASPGVTVSHDSGTGTDTFTF